MKTKFLALLAAVMALAALNSCNAPYSAGSRRSYQTAPANLGCYRGGGAGGGFGGGFGGFGR